MQFSLSTKHPIAKDSLDHLHPCGTKNDNSNNEWFCERVIEWFRGHRNLSRPLRVMDIGCAGGAFVHAMLSRGCDAIGIEGSDYNATHGQFHWPELYRKSLFTCDASRRFHVTAEGGGAANFDLITAWEVMEHISEERIPVFLDNVCEHLAEGGLFICSITSVDCPHEGVDLHVTQKGHEWWLETFAKAGFAPRRDISEEIGPERVRYGVMEFIGAQREENKTPYAGDFHCGNYVFEKMR